MTIGCQWHCTFVIGSLITSSTMTNSLWVTLHILCSKAVSPLYLLLWPTGCERLHIFLKGSYINPCLWPIACKRHLWKEVTSHFFLWPTVCEWHCTFLKKQSDNVIFSYDQQIVSGTAHYVKGNHIASFPMTNSLWATLHNSLITTSPT